MFQIEHRKAAGFPIGTMEQLGRVMFESVRFSDSPYTQKQRQAWVSEIRSGELMRNRLEGQDLFLAMMDSCFGDRVCYGAGDSPEYQVFESPLVGGFLSLRSDGYVDMAFIRPKFQGGYGIFRRLANDLKDHATKLKLNQLTTHASLSAQGPFESVGFVTIDRETVTVDGQGLDRFSMTCTLS